MCSTLPEKSRVGVISLIPSTSLRRIFAAMICTNWAGDCFQAWNIWLSLSLLRDRVGLYATTQNQSPVPHANMEF